MLTIYHGSTCRVEHPLEYSAYREYYLLLFHDFLNSQ